MRLNLPKRNFRLVFQYSDECFSGSTGHTLLIWVDMTPLNQSHWFDLAAETMHHSFFFFVVEINFIKLWTTCLKQKIKNRRGQRSFDHFARKMPRNPIKVQPRKRNFKLVSNPGEQVIAKVLKGRKNIVYVVWYT